MVGSLRIWAPRAPAARAPRSRQPVAGPDESFPRPAPCSPVLRDIDLDSTRTRSDRYALANVVVRNRSHRVLAERMREILGVHERSDVTLLVDHEVPATPLRPAA